MRYFDSDFDMDAMKGTLGVVQKIKKYDVLGKFTKLQVFDTAGSERLFTITKTYYKRANGILLVYDCSDEKTFESTSSWIEQINDNTEPEVIKVLIANKIDKPNRVITSE